jgi:hypothetical protein
MSSTPPWRDQEKTRQSTAGFTEGFDTRDLKEAKVLLTALSQTS